MQLQERGLVQTTYIGPQCTPQQELFGYFTGITRTESLSPGEWLDSNQSPGRNCTAVCAMEAKVVKIKQLGGKKGTEVGSWMEGLAV